jgi:uncharacterized protein (TIRG00374 family)
VWYVGLNTLVMVLTRTNPSYFLLAFLAYFLINILFTIRIIRVLRRQGVKATFGRTFLAHYSGMLTSDFTPGRTGYVLTPVYLMNQGIDTSASLSGVLGIQSIEFLVEWHVELLSNPRSLRQHRQRGRLEAVHLCQPEGGEACLLIARRRAVCL